MGRFRRLRAITSASFGRKRNRANTFRPGAEILENRQMLDGELPRLVVGRFLSSYATGGVVGGTVDLTYTVYNQGAETVEGVRLATELAGGKEFRGSSRPVQQNGAELGWDLGPIEPYGRSSVTVTVGLPAGFTAQVDTGAEAVGSTSGRMLADEAPPAVFTVVGTVSADWLAGTVDADVTDPVVQEKAAELDYDPQRIFTYLRDEVGYESYRGSLRGARGTLWSEAGNALDEASLGVALLRSSGIPARYAMGTLPDASARQLILSMFAEPLRVGSRVDAEWPSADPANDPELLAEAREHYWIEADLAGLVAFDTTFASSAPGQTFAPTAGVFTEVPDAHRHKVGIRVVRELTTPLADLFTGGGSQQLTTVLNVTFPAVELVGKPVSVGYLVDSQELITPLISATINTYMPYLLVNHGDGMVGDEHIIQGTSFQETLTNFPFGSQILTGVFLKTTFQEPGGPTETIEKTLFDRIGYATRVGGGQVQTDIDLTGPPALTEWDFTTLFVSPSLQSPAALGAIAPRIAALQAELGPLLAVLDGVDESQKTFAAQRANLLTQAIYLETATLIGGGMLLASDDLAGVMADGFLLRSYHDAPRLVTVSHTLELDEAADEVEQRLEIDVLRNVPRVEAYPGQSLLATRFFGFVKGIIDSVVEDDILREVAVPGETVSTSALSTLQQSVEEGRGLLALDSTRLSLVGTLALSAEARERITQALLEGRTVIVPDGMVAVGGRETTAWLESDPATGYTIAVAEDGGHQGLSEYVSRLSMGLRISLRTGRANPVKLAERIAERIRDKAGNLANGDRVKYKRLIEEAMEEFKDEILPIAFAGVPGTGEFLVTLTILTKDNILMVKTMARAVDPPVGNMLILLPPAPEFEDLGASQTDGIAVGVIHDPLFFVPVQGAQVQSVYLAGLRNRTGRDDRFRLEVVAAPAGFTGSTSLPSLFVPAGAVGEMHLFLDPTGLLPPPGTVLSFELEATSETDPSITRRITVPFVVPEIHGVNLAANPRAASSAPGLSTEVVLIVESRGNVSESVSFDWLVPAGLSVEGLPTTMTLAPGERREVHLTITPGAGVPLGTNFVLVANASFGVEVPSTLSIPVQVALAGSGSVARATITAADLNRPELANRLDDLTLALNGLAVDPADGVARSRALASLDAVVTLLSADPLLGEIAEAYRSARAPIATADTAQEVQDAVSALAAASDALVDRLRAFESHRVELAFLNNGLVAQPQTPATFGLLIRNTGSQTTTYDLSLEDLPPGLTGILSHDSITLAPGEATTFVTATMTPDATVDFAALSFVVRATAREAPELTATAQGTFTARSEFVSVVSVTTDPPFVEPGGVVQVWARVLNAVNREQVVNIAFTVEDEAGQVVFTSGPVEFTLGVLTSLDTIGLGPFDTTGRPTGNYTIRVAVTTLDDTPVPGGTGEGRLLIGSPVTATLSQDTDLLAPGTGTVTTTLVVESQEQLVGPLGVLSQTDLPGAAGLVQFGQYLYASGTGGIRVFDVSDPANPQEVRTFGVLSTILEVHGGKLYAVRRSGFSSPLILAIYDLADPANPQLLGETAPIPYALAWHLVVTDTHAFVSTWQLAWLVGNDIKFQTGDVLAFDVSNPTSPQLVDVLLNTYGTFNDGIGRLLTVDNSGGDGNLWEMALVGPDTLLVAGSTAKGDDTSDGKGVVHVVDISDPANLQIVDTLVIPGTVHAVKLVVEGNRALVTASTGGIRDLSLDNDLTGNLVLAVLDLSDPRNPTILHQQTLDLPSSGPWVTYAAALGGGRFAFSSFRGGTNGEPAIFVVDASDPTNLVMSSTATSAHTEGLVGQGNFVYTTGPAGLILYQINAADAISTTARVQIPNDNGVVVDLDSFSVAPSRVIPGAGFDTYEWDLDLTADTDVRTITWESTVIDLAPGESRPVVLGGAVGFTIQNTDGEVPLRRLEVAGLHVLGLAPPTVAAFPGAAAGFTLFVTNPTGSDLTFDLAMQGVPASWSGLPGSVAVPAGTTLEVPFSLTSQALAAPGPYGFAITATTTTGIVSTVQGTLMLDGLPALPDGESHGVVLEITPQSATTGRGGQAAYLVRVTNAGSQAESFALSVTGLPNGVTVAQQGAEILVPPGPGNYREVLLVLALDPSVPPGSFGFTVAGDSTNSEARATATALLDVVALGVRVGLAPGLVTPGQTVMMTVTNTGSATETFDLVLEGPAALVAELGLSAVTLAPGQSVEVPISTTSASFAVSGEMLLIGTATARTNTAVRDSAGAGLTVAPRLGVAARFEQDSAVLDEPGAASFVLLVENTGNVEDDFEVLIVSTTGLISADLADLKGLPTQIIPIVRLPGLATGAVALNADLLNFGQGLVTVLVRSRTAPATTSQAVARISAVQTNSNTTTQLLVSPNPAAPGQTITLQAVVTPAPGSGTPTGTVVFFVDAVSQPAVPLVLMGNLGLATMTVTLGSGSHEIRAVYGGGPGFDASTSATVPLAVNTVTPPTPVATGPRVVGLERHGIHAQPTTLVVRFDSPLDPSQARNLAAYRLVDQRGRPVKIRSVSLDPTGQVVTIQPATRLPLARRFRLTLAGSGAAGLTDTTGRLLDGDNDRQAGGDYSAIVDRSRLVLNAVTPRLSNANKNAKPVAVATPEFRPLSLLRKFRARRQQAAASRPKP